MRTPQPEFSRGSLYNADRIAADGGWRMADGRMRIKKIENRNMKYKNAYEK